MTKYIIFGASGFIGSEIIKLCEEKNLDYIGVYRKQPKNIDTKKAWIGNIEDFPVQLFKDSNIFCCLGSSMKQAGSKENFIKIDVDLAFNIASKAKLHNSSSLNVISALYASPNSKIFYSKTKGMLEEKLLTLNFTNLNIFRPSLISGNRAEFRLLEQIVLNFLKPFNFIFNLPFLLKFKVIPGTLLAKAMLYASQNYSGVNIFNNDNIHKLKHKI